MYLSLKKVLCCISLCLILHEGIATASTESNTVVAQPEVAEISTQLVAISDSAFGSVNQLLYTFLITNTSPTAIDLRNSVIQFITPFRLESIDGDFGAIRWPENKIFVSERHPKGYQNLLTLAYSVESSHIDDEQTSLKPGASIQLTFEAPLGIELEDVRTSLKLLLEPSPPMKVGQLLIKTPLPTEALLNRQAPSIEVFGENGYHQQVSLDWGQTYIIDQLPYGDYAIHTNPLEHYPGGRDQHVALTRKSPSASLSLEYERYIDTVTRFTITIPQKQESANIEKKIYLQNLTRGGLPLTKVINWGEELVLNNLIMGHRYRLWATSFTYNGTKYLPNITHKRPYEFTANHHSADKFSLQYATKSELNKTLVPILVEVTGLPLGARPLLSLKGTKMKRVYQYPISHAETTILNVISGKYKIQASVYSVNNKEFNPTISQNEIAVKEGKVNKISVIYKKVK
ncbi:hypothetical protein [Zooshikella ganghwensis]|uniref:DUF11 domain-containing protein n=1 Tax=Zooshikella ganghwensis TaxID=202772 RepID=A0A4P9VPF5_9GAMM|nr:hypothetical protein [Zooshikella ganghwensis]RDH45375.1 hypothetical protein B9G39_19045 [Zooshikella ganghwensis]